MDVLADAEDILNELGVHFEASASEATAAAMLAASINYPLRGAVTWKSTVGTNVASDALSNLASAGVKGGALIILGEDYGEGASIMQERTHAFAMKSQMWLLDPRPHLPDIVRTVEQGFELSEASHTPVMLMLRIRACHVYGRFAAKDNVRPPFSAADALAVAVAGLRPHHPAALHLRAGAGEDRAAPAGRAALHRAAAAERIHATAMLRDIGIVLQGGLYNNVLRALELLGCADTFGDSRVPLYVLTSPIRSSPDEWRRFCGGKRAVLIVEEGQPEFIEQAASQILRQREVPTRLLGKGLLPMHGEYTGRRAAPGLGEFLEQWAPALRRGRPRRPSRRCRCCRPRSWRRSCRRARRVCAPAVRSARSSAAMKLLQQEIGPLHISADIGCHSFATLPPFNMGNSIMGYGLGAAGASAFGTTEAGAPCRVMGDGGFWHNGLTSGIGNAVFNRHDGLTVIIDNGYSAATGGQDIPSSRAAERAPPGQQLHRRRGTGRRREVGQAHAHLRHDARRSKVLREALSTHFRGPKVIVAEGECQLNRQRRVRPLMRRRSPTASGWCASVSASTLTPAPAITPASACPAVRR